MADEAISCTCLERRPVDLVPYRYLGMDQHFAEVSILRVPACGHYWLRYFYEVEAFTASGRHFLGLISAEEAASLTAADAKSALEALAWYYFGGSYFDGRIGKASGPIYLNL